MSGEGYGVNAFLDTMRQAEALAVNRRIAEQGLAERAGQQATMQQLPADIAAASGAQPPVVSPAQPAVPPSMTETQGAPAQDLEGNAVGNESSVTATPGVEAKPEVRAHGTTLSALSKEIGADRVARLLSTQQGRETLAGKGVMSETAMTQGETVRQAKEEFKSMTKASWEAAANGDVVQAYMLRARAWERLAMAADDPNKAATAQHMAQETQKQALELQRDSAEKDKAQTDYELIAPAMIAYNKNPNHETFTAVAQAYGQAKSKWGIAERDRFLTNIQTASIKGVDQNLNQLYSESGGILAGWKKDGKKTAKGTDPDIWDAMNQVLLDKPELFAPLMAAYIKKPGEFPEEGAEKIFGTSVFKKDEYRVADTLTRITTGIDAAQAAADPAKGKIYADAFKSNLKVAQAMKTGSLDWQMHKFEVDKLIQGMHEDIAAADKIAKEIAGDFTMKKADKDQAKAQEKFLRDRAEGTRRILEQGGYRQPSAAPKPAQTYSSGDMTKKITDIRDRLIKGGMRDPAQLSQAIKAELKKQGVDTASPVR